MKIDADYARVHPGLSWETTAARVLNVLERNVPVDPSVVKDALGNLKIE